MEQMNAYVEPTLERREQLSDVTQGAVVVVSGQPAPD